MNWGKVGTKASYMLKSTSRMLVIRTSQLTALEQAQWDKLTHQLVDHLQHALPQDYRKLGDEGARETARVAVETGRRRGLTRNLDFYRWFNLRHLLGTALEQENWVRDILEHPDLQIATKLDLLEEQYRQRHVKASA